MTRLTRGVVQTRLTPMGYESADPITSDVTECGRRADAKQRIELHYGNRAVGPPHPCRVERRGPPSARARLGAPLPR